jgi:hypothetical protein
LAVVGFAGCSGEDPFDTGPTRSAAPEALGITTDSVESVPPAGKQQTPKPAPEPTREKAAAGVTGRGNYGSGLGGGFGTTALSTRVRVQEKLEFLQVDQALTLYKASTGELPKSHEEFMEKIIKANQINLPELREGDKYIYDPEKGQLMVDKLQTQ